MIVAAMLVGWAGGSVLAEDVKPAAVKKPTAKDESKDETPKKEKVAKLKVGDLAPPLTVDKWLQGKEVKSFAPGNVYVVEFWATWCGPCIVMMPHMSEMQAEYKDKGVTIIGFTSKGSNNSEEKVTQFVQKRGPKLGYTFAYEDEHATNDAYMKAAGRNGIPCSFVVDKTGHIAYIGHPMFLDEIVPQVVADTWKADDSEEFVAKLEKDVNAAFEATSGKDAEAGLKALKSFEDKHPKLAKIPYFVAPKLGFLVKAEKYDAAKEFAEETIAHAVEQDDAMILRSVSSALRPAASKEKALAALSLKAAEAGLKIAGDKDALALLGVADAHFAAGDKAKAKEFADKAVTAADGESAGLKNFVKNQVKKFDDKVDGDKKKDDDE
ncbi:Thiol:disulfide oxidoreductase related to ResA [Fimbriiglobus ruber]|uniref:Thiol:disulfide oxidoreductase related to ResA n=2 Tax=Fimbriiglobus ruber TaxID=1908690 RepID=A0A225DDR7_9BACT|nr:Thiol:disulfide oxidoreductase related to ResA [Fimbriiglobus ruber]